MIRLFKVCRYITALSNKRSVAFPAPVILSREILTQLSDWIFPLCVARRKINLPFRCNNYSFNYGACINTQLSEKNHLDTKAVEGQLFIYISYLSVPRCKTFETVFGPQFCQLLSFAELSMFVTNRNLICAFLRNSQIGTNLSNLRSVPDGFVNIKIVVYIVVDFDVEFL